MASIEDYRTALVASWHALLDPWPGADVVETEGWVAARCPDPVLTNGLLLDPAALGELVEHLAGRPAYAVWTLATDTAEAAERSGLVADEQTVPMVLDLPGWRPPAHLSRLDAPADPAGDPAVLERLNGLAPGMLARADPHQVYLTADAAAGLSLLGAGQDLNLSMVVTRPDRRRRGLASALIAAALADLEARGVRTVSLQATADGLGVYRRLGFVPVGRIQEWVAAR